jgi:hypothetical protein
MNMPWAASKINSAPLSKPNDGYNDITLCTRELHAGHCSMLSVLLAIESGDFFD